MNALIRLHGSFFGFLERAMSGWFLPTLARFVFAATLLVYFWRSAATKIAWPEGGQFLPELSLGGYAQVFPKAMEAVGYDPGQLTFFHTLVVFAGTAAEYILPLLIVLGLFTRLAAIGMIGFIAVQSLTDLYGHGGIGDPSTLGAWFDGLPDGIILDQRLYWTAILLVLVVKGAGPLSLDRIFSGRRADAP